MITSKPKKQLHFCEENSDIPSDFDATLQKLSTIDKSRSRKRPNRYSKESDSEGEVLNTSKKKCNRNNIPRPPTILLGNYKNIRSYKGNL